LAVRFYLQSSALCFLIAGMASCLLAQAPAAASNPTSNATPNATKEAAPSGAAYATEESGRATPMLTRKEAELRAALALHPDSADSLYALALVLRQAGKPRESLDTYTQAAGYRKPGAEELRSVALDYVVLNDYEDAIHWLEIAARMEPRNSDVLYALGRCYYSKNRFLDAAKMYAEVLAIQPNHLKAEENLGLVYDAINRPDMAEEALRKAAGWAN
jgi:tetratricopeptide (TPR) repeat protein